MKSGSVLTQRRQDDGDEAGERDEIHRVGRCVNGDRLARSQCLSSLACLLEWQWEPRGAAYPRRLTAQFRVTRFATKLHAHVPVNTGG